MNEAGAMLSGILKQPEELTPWLVLADWLQEQGDPESLAREELLRLRVQWAGAAGKPRVQQKIEKQVTAILKEKPALIGALHPLLEHKFRVMTAPATLALFLLAEYASVGPDLLAAGTVWQGALKQPPYSFPTTLHIRTREGNRFEGDMKENFRSLYNAAMTGTFHFRGVVVADHMAFVTWKLEGAAAGPGLYQFHLDGKNRWTGTWGVRAGDWNGTMWFKPKRATRRK